MPGHDNECGCMKCRLMRGYIECGDLNLEESMAGQHAEDESYLVNMEFLRL